jgi:hypothetical protein
LLLAILSKLFQQRHVLGWKAKQISTWNNNPVLYFVVQSSGPGLIHKECAAQISDTHMAGPPYRAIRVSSDSRATTSLRVYISPSYFRFVVLEEYGAEAELELEVEAGILEKVLLAGELLSK